jgi:hypothetical protein
MEHLVICVDDGLLSHQIMLPCFDSLYQGIELLVVGRLIEDHTIKFFIMIADEPSCIYLHF